MHKGSYELMKRVVEEHLDRDVPLSILDVGSSDVNGTYKVLFKNDRWWYVGADIQPGPNVDVVIDEDYKWEMFQDEQFDVVVSGQTLEHMECPWLAVKSLYRVCRSGGLCVVIAPAVWDYHPYPKDCWRIFADGMRALMVKTAGFMELECSMIRQNEPIHNATDTIFVGRKPM